MTEIQQSEASALYVECRDFSTALMHGAKLDRDDIMSMLDEVADFLAYLLATRAVAA